MTPVGTVFAFFSLTTLFSYGVYLFAIGNDGAKQDNDGLLYNMGYFLDGFFFNFGEAYTWFPNIPDWLKWS